MFESATFSDVFYALCIAVIVTFFIDGIGRMFAAAVKRPGEGGEQGNMEREGRPILAVDKLLARCYRMFPDETVNFRGLVLTRGMVVRVVMRNKKTFEGQFVGRNHLNMLCVLTSKYVLTDAVENFMEIVDLTDKTVNE